MIRGDGSFASLFMSFRNELSLFRAGGIDGQGIGATEAIVVGTFWIGPWGPGPWSKAVSMAKKTSLSVVTIGCHPIDPLPRAPVLISMLAGLYVALNREPSLFITDRVREDSFSPTVCSLDLTKW